MVPQQEDDVTFVLSSPPPDTPTRSRSGAPIKAKVVRAMQAQLEAEHEANNALDRLIAVVRQVVTLPHPAATASAGREK